MKERYEEPEVQVIEVGGDVITTSCTTDYSYCPNETEMGG